MSLLQHLRVGDEVALRDRVNPVPRLHRVSACTPHTLTVRECQYLRSNGQPRMADRWLACNSTIEVVTLPILAEIESHRLCEEALQLVRNLRDRGDVRALTAAVEHLRRDFATPR